MMEYRFADRFDNLTGSAIRAIFSLLADPKIISFAGGNPSPQTFPAEELKALSDRIFDERPDTVLQYGGTLGRTGALSAVKSLLEEEGLTPDMSELVMLTGSSQGIELMTKVFINPGDVVLVESPTFLGALQTFMSYQAELKEIEMDEYGIIPESLEAALKEKPAKFLYTIPTFQNPTGRTTPAGRRKMVYELCAKYGTMILEDDPYMSLRYSGEPQPSIKSFDTEGIVVKLMSFSKTISPGLRVGAAYAPRQVICKFNLGKQGMDVHTSNLTQDLVADYVFSGKYPAHIEDNCDKYRDKCALMYELAVKYLPEGTKVVRPEGGMFLWAELPKSVNVTELFKKAVDAGVAYVPGTHFYAHGGHNNTLRLNFTMVDEDKIRQGMKILGDVLSGNNTTE